MDMYYHFLTTFFADNSRSDRNINHKQQLWLGLTNVKFILGLNLSMATLRYTIGLDVSITSPSSALVFAEHKLLIKLSHGMD